MQAEESKLLRLYARTNGEYRKPELKLAWLEREFSRIVAALTEEQQDIVWEFVLCSDALDRELLESMWEFVDFDAILRVYMPDRGQTLEGSSLRNTNSG